MGVVDDIYSDTEGSIEIGQRLGVSFVKSQEETVAINVEGRTIHIQQSPLGVMAISGVVWDCGLLMTDYLQSACKGPLESRLLLGKTLDIGCGTGIAGISAALLGAETVCFTDTSAAEPCLVENLAIFSSEMVFSESVQPTFVPFNWSEPNIPPTLLQPWDTLLLSDVLYEIKSHEPLMVLLRKLSFKRLILAYKRRHDDPERTFLLKLEEWCFCRVIPTSEIALVNTTFTQATSGLHIIVATRGRTD